MRVGSIRVTRAAPWGDDAIRVPRANRAAPRHPARRASESTAGLLARGSPPVTAFPDASSGVVARARRLQLRGQLWLWDPWVRTPFPVRSLLIDPRCRPYC